MKTKRQTMNKPFSLKEFGRKALTVLLTISMVSMNTPYAYAVEELMEPEGASVVDEGVVGEDATSEDVVSDQEQVKEAEPVAEEPEATEPIAEIVDTAELEAANEVEVRLSFDHAYMHYKGQSIASPTSSLSIPANEDFEFAATADDGCELTEVKAVVDGTDMVLEPNAQGLYSVPTIYISEGLQVSLTAKSDPFEASTSTESISNKRNEQAEFVYEDDDIKVTATLTDPSALPADVKFEVTPVTKDTKDADGNVLYDYDTYLEALNKNADEGKEYTEENTLLYDVAFLTPKTDADGNALPDEWTEVQLAEGQVKLSFQFKKSQLSEDISSTDSANIEINHLPLKDSVRSSVETTADATDLNVNDIIVEEPKEQAADVDSEKVELSLDSLSVVAVTDLSAAEQAVISQGGYPVTVSFVDANGNALSNATLPSNAYVVAKAKVEVKQWYSYDTVVCEPLEATQSKTYALNIPSNAALESVYVATVSNSSAGASSFFDSWTGNKGYGIGQLFNNTYLIGGVVEASAARLTLKKVNPNGPTTYSVTTQFYDYDKTTQLSSLSGDAALTTDVAVVAKLTAKGTGSQGEPVAWAVQTMPKSTLNANGQMTVTFNNGFAVCDANYNTTGTTIGYDSSLFDLDVSLYTNKSGQNINSYSDAMSSNRAVSGYDFFYNQEEGTGNRVIKLARGYEKGLAVKVANNSRTDLTTDDNIWVLARMKHATTGESYFMTRVSVAAGQETVIGPITQWHNNNGDVKQDEEYTGNQELTIQLVKSKNSDFKYVNLSDSNLYRVLEEGDVIGGGMLSIGEFSDLVDDANRTKYSVQPFSINENFTVFDEVIDYQDILGNARYFGIVANEWYQSESETNAAVKRIYATQQSGNDLISADSSDVDDMAQPWFVGEVASGELHIKGEDVDVYTPESEQSKIKGKAIDDNNTTPADINFHTLSKEAVNEYIDQMMDYVKAQSQALASKSSLNGSYPVTNSANQFVLDFTGYGAGTIYLPLDEEIQKSDGSKVRLLDLIASTSNVALQIKKNSDQLIVLNSNEKNITMQDFSITMTNVDTNETKEYGSSAGLAAGKGDAFSAEIVSTLVWNFPEAETVNIASRIGGIVLAPNAAVTENSGACGGWMVCDSFSNPGGQEWHNVWQHFDQEYEKIVDISAEKTLEGNDLVANQFEFLLTRVDGNDSTVIEAKKNDENGKITFVIKVTEEGTFHYTLQEVLPEGVDAQHPTKDGITYDTTVHKVTVVVTKAGKVNDRYLTATVTYDGKKDLPEFKNKQGGDETTEIEAQKVWDDSAAKGEVSHPEVTLHLVRTVKGEQEVVAGKDYVIPANATGDDLKVKWENLPKFDDEKNEITYSVTEDAVPGYQVSITGDAASGYTITNTKEQTGDLQVSKTVVDGIGSDATTAFNFTVTLSDTSISGTYGEMEFTNGVATFSLKSGDTKTASELPLNITYTVTEEANANFTTTKTGDTGFISANLSEASFVNTRLHYGSLQISKSVVSDVVAERTANYNFTVQLKDASGNPLSGTFGDVTFNAEGEATVTVQGDSSKTISGLPAGTTYTVTEATSDNFTVSPANAEGTIPEEGTATASFTNTRKKGDLTISKSVVSPIAAEQTADYSFTIKLTPAISGTLSGVAFNNGEATVTVAGGATKTISGLPVGTTYKVTEAADSNFTTAAENATGTISSTASTAAFTNTRKTGELEVTKSVQTSNNADKQEPFSFTVELISNKLTGEFGEMSFDNGTATFELKDGESKKATGLPVGTTYKVTETANNNYTTTPANGVATGAIAEGTSTKEFVNTRVEKGELAVSKTVDSALDADLSTEFTFTVTLTKNAVSGTYGEMTFNDQGVATFTLKNGETKVATGLPKGVEYKVEEASNEYFDTTSTDATGIINDRSRSEAKFTNTRKTGELEISKKVVSDVPADTSASYTFTVQLKDASGNPLSGSFDGVTFNDEGKADVTVEGNNSVTLTGLPVGVSYTVTEAPVENFNSAPTGDSGTISTTKSEAKFTNTRQTGDLEVSKAVVSGAKADATQDFAFKVTLNDDTINGTFKDMTFKDGVAEFTLKGGQNAVAEGLPAGVGYTVTETATGYITRKDGATGTISAEAMSKAKFTNTRQTGELKISKTVKSDAAADKSQEFEFKIKLEGLTDEAANDTYSDVKFTDGEATIKLRGGESQTISGLPVGVSYTVTEAEANTNNLITTVTGDKDTISSTPSHAAFTNTRDKGGLVVTKKVESDRQSDKTKEFEFTVTLDDDTINGKYGDMKFENGVATFTLADGQTKSASGLPLDMGYTVTEEEAEGFTTRSTNATGKTAETATVAAFVNTRNTGKLTISKALVSGAAASANQTFTFNVRLVNESITKTYSDVSFVDGEATVTLKGGESKAIEGLPVGVTYTVTEDDAEGFQLTEKVGYSGTISATDSTAEFTNKADEGSLTISKTVVSDAAADKSQEFNFTIKLEGLTDEAANDTYSDVKFTDGKATITLTGGESKIISGLPIGVTYTVAEVEANKNGFTTSSKGDKGTITTTGAAAAFTNTRETGDLKVAKTVVSDAAADKDKTFSFTIQLSGLSAEALNKTYSGVVFNDGKATIELKGGESKTIEGLPTGVGYKVTETNADGFELTGETGTEGTISTGVATAAFENTRKTGDLELKKELVSDAAADKDVEFTFTVELDDKTISKAYGDMAFEAGKATVTLKGGESAEAKGLPAGVGYTITEVTADGFQNTGKTGEVGTISTTKSEVTFTNKRDEGGLKVSKTVVSDAAADKDQKFGFTVTLNDNTISGEYGDMKFEAGVAKFSLKHGESANATGLPTGVRYTVTEDEADGFTTSSRGTTGTIATTTTEAAFTNTRTTGNLTVSKEVLSDAAADANAVFTFTVKLGDETINKTYDGVEFANGEATITLKDGETKTISDLPTGITYKVTEADAEGFELTGKTGDKGTITTTGATAAFTNTRETGDLTVSKAVVSDAAADKDQKFEFKVTLSDTTINGIYGDLTFKNGVAEFELKDKESKTAQGLPTGVTYTVVEVNNDDYTVAKTNDEGQIAKDGVTATFTNTRKLGELDVSKTVESSTASDKESKEFNFTVDLHDATINKTYSDVEFQNGVAHFTLKHNQTKAITGLPTGLNYSVLEDTEAGFVTTKSGQTGTISTSVSEAKFVNTKDEGGLQVHKSVTSPSAKDKDVFFHFTVTLDDESVTGTYGDMTFNSGVAEFDLKDGDVKVANGLAKGIGYTVTETTNDAFTTTYNNQTETIADKVVRQVEVANTRKTGGFEISKRLVSDAGVDQNKTFNFDVTLSDDTISGKYGDMTFDAGKATVSLKGGETAVASGLPLGVNYTVKETTTSDDMTVNSQTQKGVVAEADAVAAYTNTRKTGDLEVSKKVVSDAAADANREFSFTVELSDKTINTTDEKSYGGMAFTDGVARFTLKGGESVKATGLPVGIRYEVTEAVDNNFNTTKSGDTGAIDEVTSTAAFTNTRKTGDLEVSKTVKSDATADHNQEFEFTVTLSDEGITGTYGGMIFDKGVATFSLKDGESATAVGLPTGITYTVAEKDNADFLTTSSHEMGEITTTKAEASFTNTRNQGGLVVSKALVSDAAADADRVFTFTVTLSDTTIGGAEGKAYGDMTFKNGVAEVTIKGGEDKIATDLPTGITYTVKEEADEDFNTTYEYEKGTITNGQEPAHATITNTRKTGNLAVSKSLVTGRAADANQQFEFQVELSDKTISKTYGGITFDAGKATVYLKNGETATAEGLPTGITYKVTETTAEGFELTSETGTEGTITTAGATAAFENTRETGDLKVSKEVVSDAAADKDQKFTFTVSLEGAPITGAYGDMSFQNGVATVTLKGGQSATAEGLPTDVRYTVTEADADGFKPTAVKGNEGTISTKKSLAAFENTRLVGSLNIKKNVTVDGLPTSTTAADGTYSFVVTGPGIYADGVTKNIAITNGTANAIQLSNLFVGDYTIAEVTDDLEPNMQLLGQNPIKVTVEANNEAEVPTAEFTNNLTTTKAHAEVTKAFNNWDNVVWDEDATPGFAFALSPVNGAPMPEGTLVANQETAVATIAEPVSFSDITFTKEGTYHYKLSEVVPEGAKDGVYKGITYDTTEHDVVIYVVANEEGKLEASVKYDLAQSDLTIANNYAAEGETRISGTKELAGRPFKKGDIWTFTISQPEGQDAPMPKNTEIVVDASKDATIDFGTITDFDFEDVGKTYTYTITETGEVEDVVNDAAKTVYVTVADNGDGTLVITQRTDEEPLVFTNAYQVHADLVAKKGIDGRDWKTNDNGDVAEEYEFVVYGDNDWSTQKLTESGVASTAQTRGQNHEAKFGTFTFTSEDVDRIFTYKVREVVPEGAVHDDDSGDMVLNGVHYNSYLYDVTYHVYEDENHELQVETSYTRGNEELQNLNILNEYRATKTTARVEAQKILTGRAATSDEFQFKLYFVNSEGVESLEQTKAAAHTEGDAYDEATKTDSLSVVFDDIPCLKAGTENYIIREVIPEGAVQTEDGTWVKDGVSYDASDHKVKIKTTDDFDGQLHAEVIYEDGEVPTFTNTYFGAEANISFNKEFYGNNLNEGAFTFTMVATDDSFQAREGAAMSYEHAFVDDGQALEVKLTNEAFNGNVAAVNAPTITYHQPGTYYYLITEDADDANANVSYDDTQIRVTVTVDSNAQASVSYVLVNGDEETDVDTATLYNNGLVSMAFRSRALRAMAEATSFTNIEPAVKKVLKNGVLRDGEFSFSIYEGEEAKGQALDTATNDVNGTVSFGSLKFGPSDIGKTYTYTIAENDTGDETVVYDTNTIKLVIAVTAGADGAVEANATYTKFNVDGVEVEESPDTFINEYDTIVIHAVKRSREEPYDPLPGAHYGLWMVNPDGEDVYMGLGRNQLEEEGSELVSSDNGDLYYDIPLLEGVAYYFLEEWPPPAGHLVDPYPTDYFTLVHDKENGKFRLVYEADDDFSKYCPGITR